MRRLSWLLVLILLIVVTLIGCGKGEETPEQAVTNALNAVKKLDWDKMQNYFDSEDLLDGELEAEEFIEGEENLKLLTNKLSFDIISSSKDGDTATVKTEITNIDMASIMGEYMQEAMMYILENLMNEDASKSEEEIEAMMEELLVDLLNRKDNKMTTSTVDIELTKSESSWKLTMDMPLQDAIFGGLVSGAEEFIGSLMP